MNDLLVSQIADAAGREVGGPFNEAERRRLHRAGIWVDRELNRIPVADIEDGHLENIVKWLSRACLKALRARYREEHAKSVNPFVSLGELLDGERRMAELRKIQPTDVLTAQPIWPHLAREIRRRNWRWARDNSAGLGGLFVSEATGVSVQAGRIDWDSF